MNDMRDIYYQIGIKLIEKNYSKKNNHEKKELIEAELKSYIATQISLRNPEINFQEEQLAEVTLHDLAEQLEKLIPPKDHFDTMRYLTHYVLESITVLQGYTALWEVSEDESLIDKPIVQYGENRMVDRLITHQQTSYVKSFDTALETLDEVVEKKEQRDRQFYKKYPKPKSSE